MFEFEQEVTLLMSRFNVQRSTFTSLRFVVSYCLLGLSISTILVRFLRILLSALYDAGLFVAYFRTLIPYP